MLFCVQIGHCKCPNQALFLIIKLKKLNTFVRTLTAIGNMAKEEINHKEEKQIIGNIIKEKFLNSGLTIDQFAERLCCEVRNVHRIFKRNRMDVDLLSKVSEALNFNFFKLYSDRLSFNNTVSRTKKKVQLNLEIDVSDEAIAAGKIYGYCEINKWE
jgi:transcriptional regulator with XRE-family HTH domain